MEIMHIPMDYYYKGSSNCYLHLRRNLEDETITITTDFGERIAVVCSGDELAKVLKNLMDGDKA